MPDAAENYCTYIIKCIAFSLAVTGLILSWTASHTCDFISFLDSDGDPPDDAADPPFNQALGANVGIFRYEITQSAGGVGGTGCVPYDDRFADQQAYPSLASAQFCAVIAPCFAALGAFLIIVDCCVCNFSGSFTFASLFLLVGSGVQAGVFTLIADPVFCFEDSELECEQGKGVYLAAGATVLFFLAASFHCGSPRSDPFCFNFGRKHEPATKSKEKKPSKIVLQPIIVNGNDYSTNQSEKQQTRKKQAMEEDY